MIRGSACATFLMDAMDTIDLPYGLFTDTTLRAHILPKDYLKFNVIAFMHLKTKAPSYDK
jgi:hypothetical protein